MEKVYNLVHYYIIIIFIYVFFFFYLVIFLIWSVLLRLSEL